MAAPQGDLEEEAVCLAWGTENTADVVQELRQSEVTP